MNSSIAEIGALEVLFDKMGKGAICILDDYGLQIAKEQTKVESEWIEKRVFRFANCQRDKACL